MRQSWTLLIAAWLFLAGAPTFAAEPVQGDWTAAKFAFHTGETMDVKLHYTTLGDPRNPAVLVLHGTGGNGAGMIDSGFGSQLFGPGQPLDAAKYYIVLPDAIGSGGSSKPSDGLKMKFPRYNYDDVVAASYRLLTEKLGVKHLRLVIGNSMGGMLTWMWGEAHPDYMDALVPLASTPAPMSGRNWMLRRMLVESIKADPAWNGGNYTAPPPAFRMANIMFGIATNGGTMAIQKQAPTREAADKIIDTRLNGGGNGDANNAIYSWDASRDYDPSPGLERITAPLLAINSTDDERNPAETGLLQKGVARVKQGRFILIPGSDTTNGHSTAGMSKYWSGELAAFLAAAPMGGR
jgi:homoserine O-acetyltransferase